MSPFKAPRPDGFQPYFYQSNWDTVRPKLCEYIKGIIDQGMLVKDLNATFIVLIPKIQGPETIHHFWPISLCNVTYKVVTKMIVNRVRQLMPQLVAPNQASFVPGR